MTGATRMWLRFERKRRFWKRVRVQGPHECWPWQGSVAPDGSARYKGLPASVLAFELARGPVPAGARVERRCADPRCVNPDHLELAMHPGHSAGA
jgi:HNH endonuclease